MRRYLLPALAFVLIGCDDPETAADVVAYGNVSVAVGFGEGLTDYSPLTDQLTVVLEVPHALHKYSHSSTTNRISAAVAQDFTRVPAARGLVTATAYRSGTTVGQATASVEVPANATASVSMTVTKSD